MGGIRKPPKPTSKLQLRAQHELYFLFPRIPVKPHPLKISRNSIHTNHFHTNTRLR